MSPTRLLRELIALPSVNPAFVPAGDPSAGEGRVAAFLARRGRGAGLQVRRQPVAPGRENLLLSLPPTGRVRQRVILAPHLDTVGGAAAQFRPAQRNGRLYGRGACDTKGSVAAMFCALAAVARADVSLEREAVWLS